ncbi:hypothetical protein D3C87_1921510 [compost metagenome]
MVAGRHARQLEAAVGAALAADVRQVVEVDVGIGEPAGLLDREALAAEHALDRVGAADGLHGGGGGGAGLRRRGRALAGAHEGGYEEGGGEGAKTQHGNGSLSGMNN